MSSVAPNRYGSHSTPREDSDEPDYGEAHLPVRRPRQGRRGGGANSTLAVKFVRCRWSCMTDNDQQLSAAARYLIDFHAACQLPAHGRPTLDVDPQVAKLRVDLITEEAAEFADATARADLVGLADALADIVYACYGAAITYGIDLDAALREVHRANMSKLEPGGTPVSRSDGKILKARNYEPPRLDRMLADQRCLPVREDDTYTPQGG
jgi:predicted HAD superfamily Cof-like phosphohydrolase